MATIEENEINAMWREVHADKQQRHAERRDAALALRGDVHEWCAAHNVIDHVAADGIHWQFILPSGVIVNWWAGTGRVQVDRRDGKPARARTVGGWDYVRALLEKMLRGGT